MNTEDKEDMGRETVVVTMRCIDMLSPDPYVGKVPCAECGEMTWLSRNFKGQKIDKILCLKCFEDKYNGDDEYVALAKEESIEDALKLLELSGIKTTREEIIKVVENKIGKKIKIVK